MDTITFLPLWNAARWRQWWRTGSFRVIRAGSRDRCIPVADTFEALAKLARAVREAWPGKIAGVTGSVGKTTTKEILAALLGAKLRVLKSEGNFNNEYGLPLTLFGLDETHQAAVLEMGMSRRGELKRLAAIARPDVGVVTRVAPAHLEFFVSVDEIALAKRELIEGLNGAESVAVLNADDPRVAAFAAYAPGKVLTYGIDTPADFRAETIEDRGASGSAFDLVTRNEHVRLEVALAGRHVISNTLAALAAASVWGIGSAEAHGVLSSLKAPFMRGELMQLSNGAALINDSYNSSPGRAAIHDCGAGRHRRVSPAHSRRGRNARAGANFRRAASRSGSLCRAPGFQGRQNRLDHRRSRRCRANCRRRGGGRIAPLADKIFLILRRGGQISGRLRGIRRRAAGQRLARRQDGTHRRRVAGALCPATGKLRREEARH